VAQPKNEVDKKRVAKSTRRSAKGNYLYFLYILSLLGCWLGEYGICFFESISGFEWGKKHNFFPVWYNTVVTLQNLNLSTL